MAHFYGTIRGNRGEASRLGSKDSGLYVYAASWEGAVAVRLAHANGKDIAHVWLKPHEGSGVSRTLYQGPVSGETVTPAGEEKGGSRWPVTEPEWEAFSDWQEEVRQGNTTLGVVEWFEAKEG